MILVLGASGYIGHHLYHYLKQRNYSVCGTYHHRKREGLVPFDLERASLTQLPMDIRNMRVAIIASAIYARWPDGSKQHWDEAYRLNVMGMIRLIESCFENNVFPIYLSSDFVFDGQKGGYREHDLRDPVTCYGRIKYEVENYLLSLNRPSLILRMGKVFGFEENDGTIFTDLWSRLKSKEVFRCSDDQRFSPLYIEELCRNIEFLMSRGERGIFHLASMPAISRYEVIRGLSDVFHLDDSHIRRCRMKDLDLLDHRPLKTDLDDTKFRELSGFQKYDLRHYLNRMVLKCCPP